MVLSVASEKMSVNVCGRALPSASAARYAACLTRGMRIRLPSTAKSLSLALPSAPCMAVTSLGESSCPPSKYIVSPANSCRPR